MKHCIFIFFSALMFVASCTSRYAKSHHVGTGVIGNNLYRECFQVYSGGALANDSYSFYLTDSVAFRKYLGTVFFDDETLKTAIIDSNMILVYRIKNHNEKDTLDMQVYLLSVLKNEGTFE